MATSISTYRFTTEFHLMLQGEDVEIPQRSIRSIITSYEYDRYNMPVIYLKIRLTGQLYNKLVLNANSATVSFRILKVDISSPQKIPEKYIEDKFIYFMSTDPNYNTSLQNLTMGQYVLDNESPNTILEGFIGLISLTNINNNKVYINDIIKNSNPLSIIHRYTSNMKMCIEPFDNNTMVRQFIIPPITSITNLIAYVNDYFTLYTNGYRYFRDFDVTYLLSTRGNKVKEKNNKYTSVIISIEDSLDKKSKINSLSVDTKNNSYIVYVDALDTTLMVDRSSDKKYTSIVGVDTMGNSSQSRLSLPASPELTEKLIVERTPSGNLSKIYNTKESIESSAVFLTVTKNEIDGSIFTPNKEYRVKNYSDSKEFDGRYILSFKKEIMVAQGASFVGSVMLGLRKVMS